ncbi:hypothetical protein CFBP5877_24915 (plasmid) [Agrobacterium tumefaciens]|uniref:Uncharacterized protein n=1 Tax=Agrobacterium tumefaciens TaxID=358 RepID=A0AAE6BJF6_AGRTU|nr:hypothetical protein CFBP5499_25665 [Agrobacterium tumefaciens]QCL82379.1 hypothetical protein CFBP5877_24915 [Agrobacterium tumefaciens]
MSLSAYADCPVEMGGSSYTIEELQDVYALTIQKAAELIDRFRGDRVLIDKIMKRFPVRNDDGKQ